MEKYMDPDPFKNRLMEFEDNVKTDLGLPFKECEVESATMHIGIPVSMVQEDVNYNGFSKQIEKALISSIIVSNDYTMAFNASGNRISWKNFIDIITTFKHTKNYKEEIENCILQNSLFPLVRIHVTDTRPGKSPLETFHLPMNIILGCLTTCFSQIVPMCNSSIIYSFMTQPENLQWQTFLAYKRHTCVFDNPYVRWLLDEIFNDVSYMLLERKTSLNIPENMFRDIKVSKFMCMMFPGNVIPFVMTPALNPHSSEIRLATYYLGKFYMHNAIFDWNALRQRYVPMTRMEPVDVIYFNRHEFDGLFS